MLNHCPEERYLGHGSKALADHEEAGATDHRPPGADLIRGSVSFLPSHLIKSFRNNIMTSKSLRIAQFQPMSCPREGQQAGNMRGAQRSSFCHDIILHTP